MKLLRIILTLLLLIFISFIVIAQDINVHNAIGQKKSDVIKKFGSPVHQDNSNPDMMCMFYKGGSHSLIFVSNAEGVYQSEASASYDGEQKARSVIDAFISQSIVNGFTVDTVTTSDFHLQKKGVKTDLQVSENKLTKKYDIKVKATKSQN